MLDISRIFFIFLASTVPSRRRNLNTTAWGEEFRFFFFVFLEKQGTVNDLNFLIDNSRDDFYCLKVRLARNFFVRRRKKQRYRRTSARHVRRLHGITTKVQTTKSKKENVQCYHDRRVNLSRTNHPAEIRSSTIFTAFQAKFNKVKTLNKYASIRAHTLCTRTCVYKYKTMTESPSTIRDTS